MRPTFSEIPGTTTPFEKQIQTASGPVVFMNTFVLESPTDDEAFLNTWREDGKVMKAQYGMLSTQLHRAVGIDSDGSETKQSNVFVNVAVWESTEAFRNALSNPEFQQSLEGYPKGTKLYPVMLKKVDIPGVCTS